MGGKSEIPITFGPIYTVFEPYFAVSLSIVVHVNSLYLHNNKRAAIGESTAVSTSDTPMSQSTQRLLFQILYVYLSQFINYLNSAEMSNSV